MKKQAYVLVVILVGFLICSGCATVITGGGTQKIPIDSLPTGALLTITETNTGAQIVNTQTPYTAVLNRGNGYFKHPTYKVAIHKEGRKPSVLYIDARVNGWYIGGNILIGGLIGWLIVDPLTGAMWTLEPKTIMQDLPEELSFFKQNKGLMVVLKDNLPELPPKLKKAMKPVNLSQ